MHFLEITHENLIISDLDFSKYTPNSTLNLSKILKFVKSSFQYQGRGKHNI